jgi:hypothetical protein
MKIDNSPAPRAQIELMCAESAEKGHESTTTTHRYVEADLAMKEKALARLEAPDTTIRRFKAPDLLMRFLQTL